MPLQGKDKAKERREGEAEGRHIRKGPKGRHAQWRRDSVSGSQVNFLSVRIHQSFRRVGLSGYQAREHVLVANGARVKPDAPATIIAHRRPNRFPPIHPNVTAAVTTDFEVAYANPLHQSNLPGFCCLLGFAIGSGPFGFAPVSGGSGDTFGTSMGGHP